MRSSVDIPPSLWGEIGELVSLCMGRPILYVISRRLLFAAADLGKAGKPHRSATFPYLCSRAREDEKFICISRFRKYAIEKEKGGHFDCRRMKKVCFVIDERKIRTGQVCDERGNERF